MGWPRQTTEGYIKKAKEKFSNKFNYSKTIYINAHTKIKIYCNKCKITFETSPNRHIRSKYGCCLECQKKLNGNIKRKPVSKFIEQSKKIFGENKFDYSMIEYKNNSTHIILRCIDCNEIFEQIPHSHLAGGNGCPMCGTTNKMNKYIFIQKAKKIHNNLYNYSKVIYINCEIKVIIYCNTCQKDFKQRPSQHLSGRGCWNCGIKKRLINRTLTKEEFIKRVNKIHDNKYDYINSNYINTRTKIKIYCKKCKEYFIITPNKHIGGRGCIRCSKYKQYSEISIKWLKNIEKYESIKIQKGTDINGEYRIPNTNLKCDGFCHENNTIYEFHGDFWHGNPKFFNPNDIHPIIKQKYGKIFWKTLHKELLLRRLGYNYICIWEYQFIENNI